MMKLDREMERRVWQRVYGRSEPPQKRYTKATLEQCHRREMANYSFYDRHRDDPVYGAAFDRLARDTQEHCKMLQQMMKG